MAFGTTLANTILDEWLGGTKGAVTVSLHTGDPGATGANECTGGSYARQTGTFGTAAASKSKANTAQIDFAGMPAVTTPGVTHYGIRVGGTFWMGGDATDVVVASGNTYRIAVGALVATLS